MKFFESLSIYIDDPVKRPAHGYFQCSYSYVSELGEKFVKCQEIKQLEVTDPLCLRVFNQILNKTFSSMNLLAVKGAKQRKELFWSDYKKLADQAQSGSLAG